LPDNAVAKGTLICAAELWYKSLTLFQKHRSKPRFPSVSNVHLIGWLLLRHYQDVYEEDGGPLRGGGGGEEVGKFHVLVFGFWADTNSL
jgi:hypothetical protein